MHTRGMIPAGRLLRVLQVDPNANTPPYDRALCASLAAAGCDVTLATSRFLYETLPSPSGYRLDERFFRVAASDLARRIGLAGRPSVRRGLKAAEYPLDWLLLLADWRRHRPDIVHAQWSFEPRLDARLWPLLQRRGVPLVYTVHNLAPHDAPPAVAARYERLFQLADGLVVHSERSASALRDRWRIAPERIAVVPHGPLLLDTLPIPREVARRQLGLPPDAELILFAGLIEPYKGLADLIEAFGQVARERPAARLVIAGKANEPFGPYQQRLRALGLLDRAVLDLAFLPEPRLAAYLCAADLLVLPYRETTASGMLFSARRFACPVVATATGDLPEIIADGESGLLSPPRSPAELATAISRLLADPGLAARLGRAGQEAALTRENWVIAADRLTAFYRGLVAGR